MKLIHSERILALKNWLTLLIRRCRKANLSDSAVVLAYYILLSIFPLLIILGNVLRMVGIRYTHLIKSLDLILPASIYAYLKPVIYSSLNSGGKSQFSVGLIVTLWSASRMIAAFQRTVNLAYGCRRPNAIMNRLASFVWMAVIVVMIVGMMFFSVFGQMLIKATVRYLDNPPLILKLVNRFQLPATVVITYGILCTLYYFVPNVKIGWKSVWRGAIVSTLGLLVLSKAFSIYLKYFSQSFSAYQALGTFIILMFWLYFLGICLLLGAVINSTDREIRHHHLTVTKLGRIHKNQN